MYDDFLDELTTLCKKHQVQIVSSNSLVPTGLALVGIKGVITIVWEHAIKKDGQRKYVELYGVII